MASESKSEISVPIPSTPALIPRLLLMLYDAATRTGANSRKKLIRSFSRPSRCLRSTSTRSVSSISSPPGRNAALSREILLHADARDGEPERAVQRLGNGVAAEDVQ